MKAKTILLALMCVFFLASCGQNTENQTNSTNTKQEFSIKTIRLGDLGGNFNAEKTAIIEASSTLSIPAESSGKVAKINFKEGDRVKAGATIIGLEDSIANYDLAVAQARNGIVLQDATAATNLTNLDTQITNAEIQYQKAELAYRQLTERNSLKYDNIVQQNKDQLATYNDTYKTQLNSVDGMMTQFLYDADKIIGVTEENRYINQAWEAYLGAVSGIGWSKSEDEWNRTYSSRGEIRKRIESGKNFTESDTAADIAILENSYTQMRKLADAMIEMLQNNVHGAGLTREMTSAWLQQWNGIRSSISSAESGFMQWKAQTNTFLENYKKNELATKIAVETQNRTLTPEELKSIQEDSELKLAYNNADLSLREAIDNAKLAMDQAKTALENTKKLRSATETQLAASKTNAEISLEQAERNAAKLLVRAPISGTITKMIAEIGQNVNAGAVMVEFAGAETQAVVEVDPRMAILLSVGQKVSAKISEETIEGTISAVSNIAGSNMLSTIRIAFPTADKFVGQPASIIFDIEQKSSPSFLLPINAVKIISE